MADSTQSSQISSSQGFGDSAAGQNSAASGKASKISESFLSSSPVTLIPSPQDEESERKAGQGPNMPSEGAATSLPSCAQPGSSPVDQGSLVPLKGGQIKGGDFKLKDERDGKAEVQRVNWDSSATLLDFSIGTLPSNPFGLDSAQDNTSPGTGNVRVFEGISENQGSIDTQSGDGFLVFKECHYGSPRPDAHNSFQDLSRVWSPGPGLPESPFEVLGDSARAKSLGSEVSDITDHSQTQTLCPAPDFESDVPGDVVKEGTRPSIPGALLDRPDRSSEVVEWNNGQASTWNKLDPLGCGVQKGASEIQPWTSPVPPPHLEPSPICPSLSSQVEDDPWKSDRDEAEILDADSSDESDDTVIEDTTDRFNLSKNVSSPQRRLEGPIESEMRPVSMALSYIKETNEHNLTEEDDEEEGVYEIVKDPASENTLEPSEPLQAASVASDWHQHSEGQSGPANSDSSSYSSVAASSKEMMQVVPSKELEFEMSREPYANLIGSDSKNEHSSHNPPSYCSLTEEWKPNELHDLPEPKAVEQVSEESIQFEKLSSVTKAQPANIAEILTDPPGLDWSVNPGDVCMPKAFPKAPKPGSQAAEDSPETASDPESIEPECSVSAATDSLVGFMRECLNSRQPKEPVERYGRHVAEDKSPSWQPLSQGPPAVLLNMEEERLTICALKELGSSQEETEDLVQWTAAPQTNSKPQSGPVAPFAPKPPSPSLNKRPWEALPGGDVDGADANEPAQLAAHALAALLTNLSVRELVYWRDPRKSGLVLGSSLLVLLSLASFSVISVGSYLLLALLCVTITFRIYKSVIQAVQKSEEGHPFKALMEKDITIPPETFRKYTDLSLARLNHALKQLKRLFLVEDLVDSLKLAVLMWLLTYVGAVFNGITLLILADILLFSSPLVYEKNKTQIDHYVGIVRTQVDTTLAKLQEKLPGAVKRSKAE